jgi:hypothetical protein
VAASFIADAASRGAASAPNNIGVLSYMDTAEKYAVPVHGNLGGSFVRTNDFNEKFYLRWGKIIFDVSFGVQVNVKVILRVYRDNNICETYIVDTDPYDIQWNHHKRRTRDFYIHPSSRSFGPHQLRQVRFRRAPRRALACPRNSSTSSWIGRSCATSTRNTEESLPNGPRTTAITPMNATPGSCRATSIGTTIISNRCI